MTLSTIEVTDFVYREMLAVSNLISSESIERCPNLSDEHTPYNSKTNPFASLKQI